MYLDRVGRCEREVGVGRERLRPERQVERHLGAGWRVCIHTMGWWCWWWWVVLE